MHNDEFDGIHGRYGVGQRNSEECYKGSTWRKNCVLNTRIKSEEKRKVTFRLVQNATEIDFVLIRKKHR